MTYGYLLIKSSQCGCHARSRIAVNQHEVRLRLLQDRTHSGQHTGGYVIEVLSLFHDIQIVIRMNIENMQHLIQHLPMLPGNTYDRIENVGILLELLDKRSHFDGLWTSAEN